MKHALFFGLYEHEIIFNAFMTQIFFHLGPIHGFAQTKKATIVT